MPNFEKLEVYQKSITLAYNIYQTTKSWPKSELFGITSQIRRSTLSITANIAEGSGRTSKEFRHFLNIARGSCHESIALLTLSLKFHLIDQKEYNESYKRLVEITKMINGLRKSIKI